MPKTHTQPILNNFDQDVHVLRRRFGVATPSQKLAQQHKTFGLVVGIFSISVILNVLLPR